MLTEDLKSLGLSDNEVRVYLALMGLGKVRAADVIKQTGLHRNLVYQAFESLSERHLATKTTQAGVFHFQATDPEHFRDQLREQELVAARVIDGLKERQRHSDQEMTVYEGEDAIRTFSLKIASELSPGENIYVLGSGGTRFDEALGEQGVKAYFSQVTKRGGGIRSLIYQRQMYGAQTTSRLQKMQNVEMRILPFDMNPSANVVFTDKCVGFQIFEKPYTVIEVRNPHLVAAYKNYFDILWNQNVRIAHGLEALRDAFTGMIDELKPGEEYYVLGGNLGPEYQRMNPFFEEIHRYRISRGVVANILAQNESMADIRERNRRAGDLEEKISHVKAFNSPFKAPMQINMVNGRAYMVIYEADAPTVIYFDHKEVHDGFKLYFDEIWNRQTETLSGHEGVIQLCERVLEEGKDWYVIAGRGQIMKTHPEYYPDFIKRRHERGIKMHLLATESVRGSGITKQEPESLRYLPESFASPMAVWIFGDNVAHVLWHEPETIFLMHDAKTAEYYRAYYHALEATAKP